MTDHDARRGFAAAITLAICFLTSAIEGFDNGSMGVAAPKLAPELHLSAQQLGLVLSGMPLGMFFGALLGGRLADALGRKTTLIIAVAVIGAFQLGTVFASAYPALIGIRIFCGLGIGAAIPTVMTLASEAAGESGSIFNAVFVMTGMPTGGMVAALIAFGAGEHGDWRTIFYVGGFAPLILAPILAFALPESQEFLKERSVGPVPQTPQGTLATLLGDGRARTTLWLWIAVFLTSEIVYVLLNWLPVLMSLKGFSKANAVLVTLPLGFGGVIGPLLIAHLMQQRRSARLLLSCYVGTIIGAIGVAEVGHNFAIAFTAIALIGTMVQAASLTLMGLAPQYYPTARRGVGTGAAIAAARLGAICGPAMTGLLLGAGLGSTQVMLSLVPLALIASVAACFLLAARNIAVSARPHPAASG
jgi:AAHS family 3-hydroxyphenylpropionic acid transporter